MALLFPRARIWHTRARNFSPPSHTLILEGSHHESPALEHWLSRHGTYVARVEDGHSVTGSSTGSTATLECGVRGDRGGSGRQRARRCPPRAPRPPLPALYLAAPAHYEPAPVSEAEPPCRRSRHACKCNDHFDKKWRAASGSGSFQPFRIC